MQRARLCDVLSETNATDAMLVSCINLDMQSGMSVCMATVNFLLPPDTTLSLLLECYHLPRVWLVLAS